MTSPRYQLCSNDVAWSSLGDESVIVHVDRDEVHLANASAAFLVDALLEGASLEDLIAKLTSQFEVEASQARHDVEQFMRVLLEAHVIAPLGGDHGGALESTVSP